MNVSGAPESVRPGDRLNIKASVYNALLDLLRDPRIRGLLGSGAVDMGRETETRVLIKNASGVDLDEGGILGLDSPLINPADNERAYKERRIYYGITPSSSSPFAILTEPIAQNAIGRAVIFGETWCKINVVNESHHFAQPESTTRLRSSSSGLARIVWKEQGLGVKNARVMLQWFDDACCTGGVGGSGGGGGGGGCPHCPPLPATFQNPGCIAIDLLDPFGNQTTAYLVDTGDGCTFAGDYQTAADSGHLQINVCCGVRLYVTTRCSFAAQLRGIDPNGCWTANGTIPVPPMYYDGPPQCRVTILRIYAVPNSFCGLPSGIGGGKLAPQPSGGCSGDCGCGGSCGASSAGASASASATTPAVAGVDGKIVALILGYATEIADDAVAASVPTWVNFGSLTPSSIAANQNDYAPGNAKFLRLQTDGSGSKNITGLSMSQVDGQEIKIENIGTDNLVLKTNSASSSAANRFSRGTAVDDTITPNTVVQYQYVGGSINLWRKIT